MMLVCVCTSILMHTIVHVLLKRLLLAAVEQGHDQDYDGPEP